MSVRKPSRVVVAGGTGGVGEGVVAAFARGGFEVLVPSRSEEKIWDCRRRPRAAA